MDDGDGAAGRAPRCWSRAAPRARSPATTGSRRWVITLVQRYLAEGEAGLHPRSRRPPHQPGADPGRGRGRDRRDPQGARPRRARGRRGDDRRPPAAAPRPTPVGRHDLADPSPRGFVTPQPHKRPKSAGTASPPSPNERWQADITHWRLADGTESRSSTSSTTTPGSAWPAPPGEVHRPDVDTAFRRAARAHGNPASLLTDNGAVFTGRPAAAAGSRSRSTLHARGIRVRPLPALPPADLRQGRTLPPDPEEVAAAQPPPPTARQLQALLDTFRGYYNTVRPHRALGRRTPAQAYTARPKAVPTGTLDRHRPLPRPPRQHRPLRRDHPAAQQPPAPHRPRPPPRRHPRPHPRPTTATSASSPTPTELLRELNSTPPATTNHKPKP